MPNSSDPVMRSTASRTSALQEVVLDGLVDHESGAALQTVDELVDANACSDTEMQAKVWQQMRAHSGHCGTAQSLYWSLWGGFRSRHAAGCAAMVRGAPPVRIGAAALVALQCTRLYRRQLAGWHASTRRISYGSCEHL